MNNDETYTPCTKCGRPMAYCKGQCCGKPKGCQCKEYGPKVCGAIRPGEPKCPPQAVIPSLTVESVSNLKDLADCFVHVSDINTTFYIDDKHRIMTTWAGLVSVEDYDFEANPLNLRGQIAYDSKNNVAAIYDKQGANYIFQISDINNDYMLLEDKPQINGVTLEGNKTSADLGIPDIDEVAQVFDTVADMKAATDLVDGGYARTLGFHSVNDGGGATYKITNTGTANEMDVIAIGDLYANLLSIKEKNVKQFGAYGDSLHNDAVVIKYILETVVNNGDTVYLPKGNYLYNDSVTCTKSIKLKGAYSYPYHFNQCVLTNSGTGGITFTNSNVIIDSIDFVGNQESTSYGLKMLGGRPNIINCCINHYDNSTGLFIGEDSAYHNTDLFVIHNVIINWCDIGCHMGSAVSGGSTLYDNNAGTASNLTISNCRIGLDIKNSNNNNFLSFEVDNCSEYGVKFTNASYNCILNPYMECTHNVYFDNDSKRNKILGSRRYGYLEQIEGNVAENMTMANSQGKGIADMLQYLNVQKFTLVNNSANGYFDIGHSGHTMSVKHSQSNGVIDLTNSDYLQLTKVDNIDINSTVPLTGVAHSFGILTNITIPANDTFTRNVNNANVQTTDVNGLTYNFWHANISFGSDLPDGVVATVEVRNGKFRIKLYNTTASDIILTSTYTILAIKGYTNR